MHLYGGANPREKRRVQVFLRDINIRQLRGAELYSCNTAFGKKTEDLGLTETMYLFLGVQQ